MKRFVFLSLSLIATLILVSSCITVQPPATPVSGTPPVIGTFSSNPSAVISGATSTLLWNVTGATSVTIDQGVGQVDVAGSRLVSPAASTIYTLSATNSAGTVTRSTTIIVNSAPPVGTAPVIVVFSSNLNADGTSTLLWNVTGADSVSIDQNIGVVNAAGTTVVSPATSTVYTLRATNSSGTVNRSVAITVSSSPPVRTPPVIVFSSNLNSDNTSTLSWNVTGADQVSIDQNIGIVNASGTKVVSPATSTIYTLSATYAKGNSTNDIGTVTKYVTVPASGSNTPWVH